MPVYFIYWLLSSNNLKCEDEHTVLQFVFHYTNLLRQRKDEQMAVLAADQLTKALRFNFIDFYNLMSATRKNVSIQASPIFEDTFIREMGERMKLKKPNSAPILPFGSKERSQPEPTDERDLHFCGVARKYFTESRIESQGRSKVLKAMKSEVASVELAKEFADWAFHSKIQNLSADEMRVKHQYSVNATSMTQAQHLLQQKEDEIRQER